ncbi:MAG: DUF4174 domain-containing protein [Bacteroidota bacterium]
MRSPLLVVACALAMPAMAQEDRLPFTEADHRWQHRLVYLFAPSDSLGAFAETVHRFREQQSGVAERDGILLALPQAGSPRWLGAGLLEPDVGPAMRRRYEIVEEDAVLVLVGKDGTEKARYALPANPEDVFARIDTMPMRQREMRQRDDG